MLRRSKRRARREREGRGSPDDKNIVSSISTHHLLRNALYFGSLLFILGISYLLMNSQFVPGDTSWSFQTNDCMMDEKSSTVGPALRDTTKNLLVEVFPLYFQLLGAGGRYLAWHIMVLLLFSALLSAYASRKSRRERIAKSSLHLLSSTRKMRRARVRSFPYALTIMALMLYHSIRVISYIISRLFQCSQVRAEISHCLWASTGALLVDWLGKKMTNRRRLNHRIILHWIASLLFAQCILEFGSYMLGFVLGEWFHPFMWQASNIHHLLASVKTCAIVLARFLPVVVAKVIQDARYFNCSIMDCFIYRFKSMIAITSILSKAYIATSVTGRIFQYGACILALWAMPETMHVYSLLMLHEHNSNWMLKTFVLIALNILSGVLGYLTVYSVFVWTTCAIISLINCLVNIARLISWTSILGFSMTKRLVTKLGCASPIPKPVGFAIFISMGLWNIAMIGLWNIAMILCFASVMCYVKAMLEGLAIVDETYKHSVKGKLAHHLQERTMLQSLVRLCLTSIHTC